MSGRSTRPVGSPRFDDPTGRVVPHPDATLVVEVVEMTSNKPTECPACGGRDWIPVLWGLPSSEAIESFEAGEIALGGCCPPEDWRASDYWACRTCGHQERVRAPRPDWWPADQ
jgi:hypothetical protein